MAPGIDRCVNEAIEQLSPQKFYNQDGIQIHENQSVDYSDCEIYVWQQTWGSTTCGFGGCGGQMMTSALTVVVIGPMQDACVYHANRFAYKIKHINQSFRDAVLSKHMPGVREGKERNKMELKKEPVAN